MKIIKGFVFCLAVISLFIPVIAGAEGLLTVSALNGKVSAMVSPSTEWTEAKAGQVLNLKDAVKTEENSSVLLEFPDKSSVTLKQGSEVSVEELVWTDTGKMVNLNMSVGEMRVILQKLGPNSDFKVTTPTAVCGARGSLYYIRATKIRTRLYVEDGMIELLNRMSGEKRDVGAGKSSDSNEDGTVTEPAETPQGDKDAFTAGWDAGLVAEPYTKPEDKGKKGADEVEPPEVTPERKASEV